MWVVYTEIHEDGDHLLPGEVERWYYGRWADRDKANEVAIELGNEWPTYHCVCAEEDAEKLGIQNMYR